MPSWTHIFLVRHGTTPYNLEGRVQGQVDVPLHEQGIREAEATAAMLAVRLDRGTRIFSSDLDRAQHTARIIAEGLGVESVETMPEVRERGMGSSEGMRWADLPADAGGDWEPAEEFSRRVLLGLRQIAERGAGQAVVVTHAGVIGAVREMVGLHPAKMAPGEVLEIEVSGVGGIRVARGIRATP